MEEFLEDGMEALDLALRGVEVLSERSAVAFGELVDFALQELEVDAE